MPLPQGYRAREGDVVTMTGTVMFSEQFDSDPEKIYIKVGENSTRVARGDIDLVSRAWEIGDSVKSDETLGKIFAIVDEWAWVLPLSGQAPQTVMLQFLEYVPPKPSAIEQTFARAGELAETDSREAMFSALRDDNQREPAPPSVEPAPEF